MELFRCKNAPVRLACALRWTKTKAAKPGIMEHIETTIYRGCDVGEAHAAGERPDVQTTDVVARRSARPARPARPERPPAPTAAVEKREPVAPDPEPDPEETTPDEVHVEAVQGETEMPKFQPRTCPCGTEFNPKAPRQQYCKPTREARPNPAKEKKAGGKKRKKKGGKRAAPRPPTSAMVPAAPVTEAKVERARLVHVDATAGAAALLKLAGYRVEVVEVPAGNMIVVEGAS